MANELIAQSQSRSGATVLWVTIHTAEGPTDAFPADHNRDSGSAQSLLSFFEGKTDRSCHAIADDDVILDNLVPYERAAWTLRGGNNRSDNIELCGLATWTRAEWMLHKGMLHNAAVWIARRCTARGILAVFIGTEGVRLQHEGVIGHVNYTDATHDGTHWDPGPNFPWDVVMTDARNILSGPPTQGDDGTMAYGPNDSNHLAHLDKMVADNLGKFLAMGAATQAAAERSAAADERSAAALEKLAGITPA